MSELIDKQKAINATWQELSYTAPLNVLTEVRDRIKAIPAATRWVRVEDELPKEVGSYLTAYCDGFVCENEWNYIRSQWYGTLCDGPTAIGWVNDGEAVRYWMPLPEPPGEE